jgi:hypothetical protein
MKNSFSLPITKKEKQVNFDENQETQKIFRQFKLDVRRSFHTKPERLSCSTQHYSEQSTPDETRGI